MTSSRADRLRPAAAAALFCVPPADALFSLSSRNVLRRAAKQERFELSKLLEGEEKRLESMDEEVRRLVDRRMA